MRSAPSFERMLVSSNGAPGSWRALEPVATITCLAVIVSSAAPATLISYAPSLPATNEPRPWKKVTLFFLNRYCMPSLFCFTTVSLRPIILATSIFRSFIEMPWSAKPWPACSKCSLDCSSALDGMQPTFRQVPPRAGPCPLPFFHSSMQAVFRPSCAARMAAM